MADLGPNMSTVTLIVSDLNISIKKQRLAVWL